MNPVVTQLIGFLALGFVVASFQKDKRSFLLVLMLCGASLFVVHYLLLGAWTGAAMYVLSAARAYVFRLRDTHAWINRRATMLVFILAFWIAGVWSWEGSVSLLPILSMTVECIALWSDDTKRFRRWMLLSPAGWVFYGIAVGSYAGIATSAIIGVSLLVAVARFDVWPRVRRRSISANRKGE